MKQTLRSPQHITWIGNRAIFATLIVISLEAVIYMAHRVRLLLLIAQLLVTLPTLGQQVGSDVSIKLDRYKTSDLFMLTLQNKNGTDVIVRITNDHKEVIFEQSIRFVERVKKIYNLSTLPKGQYQFSVANTAGASQSITITTTESFENHPETGKTILVGFSKISRTKTIHLTIQNKTKAAVSLFIVDELGRTIQQQSIGTEEVTKKEISLVQIPKGKYWIKVGNKENQFQTQVII